MIPVAEAIARLEVMAAAEPTATLTAAFAAAGRELALVGGPVRDAFLGREASDLDFATDATPDQILAIVEPISSATWDVGRAFGTIAARVRGRTVEITTYRADSYDGITRKPTVEFGDSLEADLRRRDFTVNAMALSLPGRALVDPTGGLTALHDGVLTTPISAEISFGDDPLRMMRAARFTSQLGLHLDDETRAAMTAMAPSLEIVSVERIADELMKLMRTDDPIPGLEVLVDTGLAEIVIPELPALRLEVDEHAHHKDVYEHTLTALRQAIALERSRHPGEPADTTLRLAVLLHDIGKPATKRVAGRVVSFHNHDIVGAKLAAKRLRTLKLDKQTIESVRSLVALHLRFFGYTDQAWTDSAVRRYVRDAGDELERLHILTRADVTTRNRRKADRLEFAYDDLEERIAELAEAEGRAALRPDLDGEQIMAVLGIAPGPEVGLAYRFLMELRLDEGPLGEEIARERLLAWWAQQA